MRRIPVCLAALLAAAVLSVPATAGARPSLKGTWEGKAGYKAKKYYPDMLRVRITSLRKKNASITYAIDTYDGSPGSFSNPDCKISLRFKRRKASRYYFKGKFQAVGLGCPYDDGSSHTVILRRKGSRLLFRSGDYTSSLRRK